MNVIWMIIVGFLVGLVARAVMPGNDKAGIIVTSLLGILGAVVGTYLGQGLGWYGEGEPAGFIMSVIGALILLYLGRRLSRKF